MIYDRVIMSSDRTALDSVTYEGRRWVELPGGIPMGTDRGTGRNNIFAFEALFRDGTRTTIQVNSEFESLDHARKEAESYAADIGRLPRLLRVGLEFVTINRGTLRASAYDGNIIVYTDNADVHRKDNVLEEVLMHEAAHASLDASHGTSLPWKQAQESDASYISEYAQGNPEGEDLAESFVAYFVAIHRGSRIGPHIISTIRDTIPNRIEYFESIEIEGKWCPVVIQDCPDDGEA